MHKIFQHIENQLKSIYPQAEAREIALRLLEHVMGRKPAFLFLGDTTPNQAQNQQIAQALDQLLAHRPLQYILGKTNFYGYEFEVNENVLIPRPETEELVHLILQTNDKQAQQALDLCTGSGCIALSLACERPNWQVQAVELSEKALAVANTNAQKLACTNIEFWQADVLQLNQNHFFTQKKWDIIVSNPPYVPQSERKLMRENVTAYEPAMALFVEDKNPLLFYETIATFARQTLRSGGFLFFEIHENYAAQIALLLREKGLLQVEIHTDFFNKARMIKAQQA